jgi:hypothetical protein
MRYVKVKEASNNLFEKVIISLFFYEEKGKEKRLEEWKSYQVQNLLE